MNDELIATWVVLFSSGVATQYFGARFFKTRIPNRSASALSALFLLGSMMVVGPALGNKAIVFFLITTVYLLFNSYVQNRWQFHALRTLRQVRHASVRLTFMAILALGLASFDLLREVYLAELGFILALYFSLKVILLLDKSRMSKIASTKERPTLTFATPARNETHALTQHLKTVVATEYKKIEFLVLDDCSQDDTAQIIRSFAHDGVRFIQGDEPIESWVGKNQAYKSLAAEASGDYIIFSGVDTRYEPETIGHLIDYMTAHKKDMISVMPRHENTSILAMMVQPMRYFFMLATSSRKRPPVLSTVWVIKATALEHLGGIDAVSKNIIPEGYFARQLAQKNKYQFVVAPRWLGLTTRKKVSSQIDTALRTLYPQLHKRIFNHYLLSLAVFAMIVYPVYAIATWEFGTFTLASTFAIESLAALALAYAFLISRTYRLRTLAFAPLLLPLSSVFFYYITIRSMLDYEHDEIIWKGRNVCTPVMLQSVTE